MKIRQGFVSNSSSSSFVVPFEKRIEAEEFGLKLVEVFKIIGKLMYIKETIQGIPDFIQNQLGFYFYGIQDDDDISNLLNELLDLSKIHGIDVCITEPYDRDAASRRGINYEVFLGDL